MVKSKLIAVSCRESILLLVSMKDNICEVKFIEKSKKRLMRSRMPLNLVIANYRSRIVCVRLAYVDSVKKRLEVQVQRGLGENVYKLPTINKGCLSPTTTSPIY